VEEEGEDGEEREGAKGRPQAEKAGRREPALKEQPRAFESRRGGLNEPWREASGSGELASTCNPPLLIG